jgi:hypothetical protein
MQLSFILDVTKIKENTTRVSYTRENRETPQCEGNGKDNRHSQTTQFEENDDVY